MINSLELFIKKKDAKGVTKKWLDRRRSYLQKLKFQAGLIAGYESSEILDYAMSNVNLYKKVWFKDSEAEFFKYCANKKVILCGDFHSSPSIKRFYIRLFKSRSKSLALSSIIALECFEKSKDSLLQEWLNGNLSDDKLLKDCAWDKNWGFSWKSYKNFILQLKNLGFELRGINSLNKDFKQRDCELAQNLAELSEKGKKIFCFMGQYHLGPENLPKNIEQVLGADQIACLHVDPEEIYFILEEYNLLKDIQVLSLNNHFCFLSTPPWVHWQNHLHHLDNLYKEGDDEENQDKLRGEDYNAVVFDYVQLLRKDLNITEELKQIDIAFIDEYLIKGRIKGKKIYEIMQPLLDSETSFYWPEHVEGIMVESSLNQAACVAGKYLHVSLMKTDKLPWGETDSFEAWCWLEAIGHMLSKLINPKRAVAARSSLSAFLSARFGKKQGAKLLKTLVHENVLELDQGRKKIDLKALTWPEIVYASRLKGSLVGESLFKLYLKGKISSETLRTYLSVPIDNKKRFSEFYNLVLQRLDMRQD